MSRWIGAVMVAVIVEGFVNGMTTHIPNPFKLFLGSFGQAVSGMEGSAVTGQIVANGISSIGMLQFVGFIIPLFIAFLLGRWLGALMYVLAFLGGILILASPWISITLLALSIIIGIGSAIHTHGPNTTVHVP